MIGCDLTLKLGDIFLCLSIIFGLKVGFGGMLLVSLLFRWGPEL